ncbi:MAG: AraC family transcriptional regulator [Verrucomicrobiota bacterium]|nr:AraC family transcriptional regulator [Verrucomicrobiota bacterium]
MPDTIPYLELFSEIPSDSRMDSLRLVGVGHYLKKTELVDFTFNFYAIGIVLKGSGVFRQINQSGVQRVNPPFYFFVWPGVPLYYGPQRGEWWEERFITLNGIRPAEWHALGWLGETNPTYYPLLDPIGAINLHKHLGQALQSRDSSEIDYAKLCLERYLFDLAGQGKPVTTQSPVPAHQRYAALVEQWRKNPLVSVDMHEVARTEGLSYSRFRQSFAKEQGLSPCACLLNLRMEVCAMLLRTTDTPVKEIAFRAGYSCSETFIRAFHNAYANTPNSYRQTHQHLSMRGTNVSE